MSLSTPETVGGQTAAGITTSLNKGGKPDVAGRVIGVLLLLALLGSLLILLTLVVDLINRSWSVWADGAGDFLSGPLNSSDASQAGVWQGIKGTLQLMVVVVVAAFPLGIACAVYLEEYAGKSRLARFTRLNVRNLAGVPSIVYGLLGLALFVQTFNLGRTVWAGGLALSALVLPIVVITASEALRAVPASVREGAFGVGATRWEVTRHHVVPAATPGILTGVVLSLARAAGEAAPILLVGAATGLLRTGSQSFWEQLGSSFTAMPVIIFSYARQPGEDFRALTAAASLVLLVVIVLMNAVAIWLRNRYQRQW
ncbi:MAG: phosphate ABC transporter permease PstA [Ilumatobacteraceae bacterium]|nr:phosphate ABC transporter permease PstA [Ilumatobacteraceae bacterium]